jgi:selenide,water dikinase
MCSLPVQEDPNLLVGLSKADDAGVYRLSDDIAVVQTVDFIAPIVNDPYSFGVIAAANALSDVYTMGGKPITAMNLVCFPSDKIDISILTYILNGALDKLNEAEVALVGGHSVKNDDLKFGLSVTGVIAPKKVITSSGAQDGDVLILTKPIGIGVMTTAIKAGLVDSSVESQLIQQMAMLNRKAAEIMVPFGVNACTDITGVGLIGHACKMAENSEVSIELFVDKIPLIDKALEFCRMGIIPRGAYSNRNYYDAKVEKNDVKEELMDLYYDPQTSGGLFISIPEQKAEEMLNCIKQAGYKEAAIVGRVLKNGENRIILR